VQRSAGRSALVCEIYAIGQALTALHEAGAIAVTDPAYSCGK